MNGHLPSFIHGFVKNFNPVDVLRWTFDVDRASRPFIKVHPSLNDRGDDMVGVMKLIARKEKVCETLKDLEAKGYNHVVLYYAGSMEHTDMNLNDNQVLVKAWRDKGRV